MIPINELVEKYYVWCTANRSERTLEWYRGHLSGFLKHLGEKASIDAEALKPFHIMEWVDSNKKWGSTYKRGAITAAQRLLYWAEEMGYIETHQVKKVKKPAAKSRQTYMKQGDFDLILSHLSETDPFKDFLRFMWQSGCRPQEARAIEPRHVFLDRKSVIFPAEESKGKTKKRVIYLNDTALEIISRLVAGKTTGKLFVNNRGTPWTKWAICNRMHRMSKTTGRKFAAYDARHGFATRKLVQGHDHLTIAALMGHTDGVMIAKIYSHVDQDEEHLRKALAD